MSVGKLLDEVVLQRSAGGWRVGRRMNCRNGGAVPRPGRREHPLMFRRGMMAQRPSRRRVQRVAYGRMQMQIARVDELRAVMHGRGVGGATQPAGILRDKARSWNNGN